MWPVSSYRLPHVAYTHLQVEIRRGGNKWTWGQTGGAESETGRGGAYGAVTHYRKPRDVCLTLLQLWQTIKSCDGRIYSLICSDNCNLVLLSFANCKYFFYCLWHFAVSYNMYDCQADINGLLMVYNLLMCSQKPWPGVFHWDFLLVSKHSASVFMSETLKMSENHGNYLERISPISVN